MPLHHVPVAGPPVSVQNKRCLAVAGRLQMSNAKLSLFQLRNFVERPHHLVVGMSRCGRDNPG